MERHKALFTYNISDDDARKAMVALLEKNLFEPLEDSFIYGLPLEVYQVKVQQVKTLLQEFCRENLGEGDSAFFYESRMNEERNLSTIIRTNLLENE